MANWPKHELAELGLGEEGARERVRLLHLVRAESELRVKDEV